MQMRTRFGAGLNTLFWIALAMTLAVAIPANGTASDDPLAAALDEALSAQVAKGFAGTVFIQNMDKTILSKGYGLADPKNNRAMTPQTGFDIGSLTKPFTAAAILKLEAQGKLSTNDPISKYIPQITGPKGAITVWQLLNHTSGLPDILNGDGRPVRYTTDFDYEPVTRDEIVRRAALCKLQDDPGKKESYSNLGYSLLAVIIEKASAMPYEDYVRTALFDPAGMTRTGYLSPHWTREELAVGVDNRNIWGTPLDHPWLPDGPSWNLRGNGGMLSTAEDLGKWIAALKGEAVLPASAKDKLFQLLVHKNARGTRTMGPAGSNTVFDGAYLWYLDENRLIVVLTSNNRVLAEDVIPNLAATMRDFGTTQRP